MPALSFERILENFFPFTFQENFYLLLRLRKITVTPAPAASIVAAPHKISGVASPVLTAPGFLSESFFLESSFLESSFSSVSTLTSPSPVTSSFLGSLPVAVALFTIVPSRISSSVTV